MILTFFVIENLFSNVEIENAWLLVESVYEEPVLITFGVLFSFLPL